MRQSIFLTGFLLLITGCNEGGVAALDEQATRQAQKSVEAEHAERVLRAEEMEKDLSARHRFYEGVRGVYEGTVTTDAGQFQIRLTLIPSLPSYRTDRTRTLEEIASDLSNLHFNVQVVQWSAGSPMSAVGCRIENVHPDIYRGSIEIASEACPNVYRLKLAQKGGQSSGPKESEEIAQSLIAGRRDDAGDIVGQMYPTTTAAVYQLTVSRVSP
jgi:hypothetical protein